MMTVEELKRFVIIIASGIDQILYNFESFKEIKDYVMKVRREMFDFKKYSQSIYKPEKVSSNHLPVK